MHSEEGPVPSPLCSPVSSQTVAAAPAPPTNPGVPPGGGGLAACDWCSRSWVAHGSLYMQMPR